MRYGACGGVLLVLLAACQGNEPRPVDDYDPGNPPPTSLELVRPKNDGSGQSGTVGKPMFLPLRVRVMSRGNPIPGIIVTWVPAAPASAVNPEETRSDPYGYASTSFTPSTLAGVQGAKAVLGNQEELFVVYAVADGPNQLVSVRGDGDSAQVALSLHLKVLDQYGNGVPDVLVGWTIQGDATIPYEPDPSDNLGRVGIVVEFGPTRGPAVVTASVPGTSISPITFNVKSY